MRNASVIKHGILLSFHSDLPIADRFFIPLVGGESADQQGNVVGAEQHRRAVRYGQSPLRPPIHGSAKRSGQHRAGKLPTSPCWNRILQSQTDSAQERSGARCSKGVCFGSPTQNIQGIKQSQQFDPALLVQITQWRQLQHHPSIVAALEKSPQC
jgi:hypothetical protein